VDEVANLDANILAKKMVGRDFSQVFPPKKDRRAEEYVLEVENLSSGNMVKDVSFSLHRGEILGFAGLVGSGRTETMEAVMGLRKLESGEIRIKGKPVRIRNAKDAVSHGLGYISEDRQGKGIVMNYDITKNISLISLKDKYMKGFLIDKKAETAASDHYIDEFNIVAASAKSELRFFSGGNQQKVYLARWMDTDPEILILDEPTRGIDINAKREIYEFIHRLSEARISCIIISSEMEEIIGMCNRAYVMREGKIASCLNEDQITEENIVFNATGIKKGVEKDG
jgi:ribose transport system ATP-binding protein